MSKGSQAWARIRAKTRVSSAKHAFEAVMQSARRGELERPKSLLRQESDEPVSVDIGASCENNAFVRAFASFFCDVRDMFQPGSHMITLKEQRELDCCLLYTSPSPRDKRQSRMPSSA